MRGRKRQAMDEAAYELLFLVEIEGMRALSRGGKGCVFRAIRALRPDIAERLVDSGWNDDLLREFFPDRCG